MLKSSSTTQWQGRTIGTRFGVLSAQEMINIEVSAYVNWQQASGAEAVMPICNGLLVHEGFTLDFFGVLIIRSAFISTEQYDSGIHRTE
jgi:hypothetical protein